MPAVLSILGHAVFSTAALRVRDLGFRDYNLLPAFFPRLSSGKNLPGLQGKQSFWLTLV
jgi:hypothetical protein